MGTESFTMTTKPHAASDPQLPCGRRNSLPVDRSTRLMKSVSGETFGRKSHRSRTTTYGSVNEQPSCCVAGEHFLTSCSQDFVHRSLSMDSMVNISDVNGDGQAHIIPTSLRRCQNLILTPYGFLLSLFFMSIGRSSIADIPDYEFLFIAVPVGWRPWFKETITRCSWLLCLLNFIYPVLVVAFMLFHFGFQVLSCQGKYDINVCTKSSDSSTVSKQKLVTKSTTFMDMNFAVSYPDTSFVKLNETICCQHILPTYIVPTIMHLLAYGYGFVHFRIQECEQLYALMERVFLQATPAVQKALVRNSRFYLFAAGLWLAGQIALEVLYYETFTLDDGKVCLLETLAYQYRMKLLPLKLVGMILVQCVNMAILVNYCTQCEVLVLYIKHICLSLHERSIQIQSAMHEILGVREFITLLNGNIGKMVAFCMFNFGELVILGTTALILNQNYKSPVCIYRIIYYCLIFCALLVPLIQAARLSRTGCKIRQISFQMRVFGYQNASQLELDSFVLFVSGATLRAKLFGVAIRTSSIMFTFGAAAFILLTLMVIDIFSISGYKKIF